MIALYDAARSLDCQDGLLTIPGAPLTRTSPGAPHSAQMRAHMSKAFRWILLSAAVLSLALALQPAAEGDVKFTGKFYAVPHYAIPLSLFYGKDLLEKVSAQPPDTWEAINEISVKIKKAGLQDFPQGFPWNRTGDGYDPAMSLLWSYGAAWVDKSGRFTGIPKAQGLEALKMATRSYLVDKTSAFDYLSWSGSTNNESFMAGK